MSEKGFLGWNDEQLKTFVFNLVAQGEQFQKLAGQTGIVDALVGTGQGTVVWQNLVVSNALYTKAVIMELERLNKKIEELVQAIKH